MCVSVDAEEMVDKCEHRHECPMRVSCCGVTLVGCTILNVGVSVYKLVISMTNRMALGMTLDLTDGTS